MHTDEIFGSFKINSILNIKTKINRKKRKIVLKYKLGNGLSVD